MDRMSEALFLREYIANHGYPAPEAPWNPDTHCEKQITISLTPEEMLMIGSTWAVTINGPHTEHGQQSMLSWADLGIKYGFDPGTYTREMCAWCVLDLLVVGANFVVLMLVAPEKVGIGVSLPDFVIASVKETVSDIQSSFIDQMGFTMNTLEKEWNAARYRHS